MPNARMTALTALEKCRRANAWSDAVLGSVMDADGLAGRDRGLCTALCYGVMQQRLLLDAAIGRFSSIKVNKLEPKVLDILRMSAYQILFMDRIPDSAAVNEAVNLSKKLGYARASGLVNAVLRKIAANKPACLAPTGKTEAETLSLRYSHPQRLVEYFLSLLGGDTEALLAAHNTPVPITVQVNTLKTDADTLLAALTAQGIAAAPHPFLPDCLVLDNPGSLASMELFTQGHFYVQDAAAKLSVLAAGVKPGDKVLDVCSAPGGKSFAAAMDGRGEVSITSCDIHEKKLTRIREGAQRLGIKNLTTRAADGRVNIPDWRESFNVVIADVPCSGLGVIRKKPDIRYKDMSDFDALPAIGLAILNNAAAYVAPGGVLLYSTCTLRPEENGDVVSAFLAENAGFAPEDFTLPGIGPCPGSITLWPHIHNTDGFFFAKLRRKI